MKNFKNDPKTRGIKGQKPYLARYPCKKALIYKLFKANSLIEFVERAVLVSKTIKFGGD